MSTIAELLPIVTVGVDTHCDTHTAAVLDARGALLAVEQFPANGAGYVALEHWACRFGKVDKIGVEGTGSWGAGLTAHLQGADHDVIEVDQPDRKARRQRGKSDPVDAEAAARAVMAGTATTVPKDRDSKVECLRVLRVAKNSATKARSEARTQLKSLISTAPEPLRAELRDLNANPLVKRCAAFKPKGYDTVTNATKTALRSIARRIQTLTDELVVLQTQLNELVTALAPPSLLERCGVGPDVAGQLLVSFGANAQRIATPAKFTRFCGTAPIPVSSGRTDQHRLNRGGDRQANAAIHRIAIVRLRYDQRSIDYVNRRINEGKPKRAAIRCLKNYIAREIYGELTKTRLDDL